MTLTDDEQARLWWAALKHIAHCADAPVPDFRILAEHLVNVARRVVDEPNVGLVATPEPGLDVRRLRQAMRRTGLVDYLPGAVAYAEDIAREYAHASSEGQSAGKQ